MQKAPSHLFGILLLAATSPFPSQAGPLPEGHDGIAANYLGDVGIAKDANVVFVENFDAESLDAVVSRWDEGKGKKGMEISDDVPAASGDRKSLRITHVGGQGDGSHLYRRLPPGHDRLFARWYVKFDPDCWEVHHFGTHLGGFNPPTPWPQGGAGERSDGAKRFTSGVEPYGKGWSWDFYSYWQGMHRHGDGRYWGTPFLSGGEKPPVEKGKWICVEMMLKMNDPVAAANGEQAFWIDGKLFRRGGQVVSHAGPGFPRGRWAGGWWQPDADADSAFEGLRWRTDAKLNINYLWTYLYLTKAPAGHVSRVWFDNIVVAKEYIGPMREKGR